MTFIAARHRASNRIPFEQLRTPARDRVGFCQETCGHSLQATKMLLRRVYSEQITHRQCGVVEGDEQRQSRLRG